MIAEWARDHEILWINSTGNHALHHYQGEFTDSNQNGYHEFNGDEIGIDEANCFYLTAGEEVSIYLSWDGDRRREQDYDLFLTRHDMVVASSADRQAGISPATEEIVSYFPPVSGDYGVKIKRHRADEDQTMILFVDYPATGLAYHTPGTSLLSPSDAAGVMAVGAISSAQWEAGGFPSPDSSRSPTLDGRIKPDVMGPGALPVTFGNFTGSSPACAYIGGLAAFLKTLHPNWQASELASVLTGAAIDLGEPGKDPLYGSGKVDLSGLMIGGNKLHFPHVAMTARWWTGVAITNFTDQPASLNIFAYDDAGRLLSFRPATLPSHGILSGTAAEISGVLFHTGSLTVTADQQLAGIMLYGNSDDIAMASAINQPHCRQYFPCQSTADGFQWTGLALLNPNDKSTAITLSLLGDDGVILAKRDIILPAGEKLLGKIADIFLAPLGTAAAVAVQSWLPVAGLAVTGEPTSSAAALAGLPSGMPTNLIPPLEAAGLGAEIALVDYNLIHAVSGVIPEKVELIRRETLQMPQVEDELLLAAWHRLDFVGGKNAFLPALGAGPRLVIPYLVYQHDWDTVCLFYNPAPTAVVAEYRVYSAGGGQPSEVGTVTIPSRGCYSINAADISPNGVGRPFRGSLFLDAAGPVYGAAFLMLATESGGWAALPAQMIHEKQK